jgi:methylmalonyl-CoA mutase
MPCSVVPAYSVVLKIIEEVESIGGMTKAIESGMAKLRIEEAATKKQARIDSREETIVGVNKYQLKEPEHVQVSDCPDAYTRASS